LVALHSTRTAVSASEDPSLALSDGAMVYGRDRLSLDRLQSSNRRAGFCAGSAALPGEQYARAPRAKLVCRSRFDLTVLRHPHTAAGQNARLCRFRPGGFSAGSLGRTLRGKSRIGPVRLSLRPSLRHNATAMAIWGADIKLSGQYSASQCDLFVPNNYLTGGSVIKRDDHERPPLRPADATRHRRRRHRITPFAALQQSGIGTTLTSYCAAWKSACGP
jgi:hypothetical protein